MSEPDAIGARLKRLRRDRSLTQEELAGQAEVSVDLVAKLEQGRRSTARVTSLIKLANALDVDLSELVGKRPRLGAGDDVRVLAIRDAVICPELLPGMDADDGGEAPDLGELRRTVELGWRDYWAGNLAHLGAVLPGLIGEARLASRTAGPRASGVLAQAYQLAACLLVHLGKDDLAALAAERALGAAEAGGDELQAATLHGTYAWALLHQGRTQASEDHAVRIAERTEPSLTKASPQHLTVWGGLMLTAMAAAAAGGRAAAASEYIGLARSAAGRFDHDRMDYQVSFGPSQVAMQATHAHAVLREPGRALQAAGGVSRGDLPTIAYGRHLIDVAQAHVDAGNVRAAESTLREAESLSAQWFRHQGPARSLVGELVEEATRLSPGLRHLARSVDVER